MATVTYFLQSKSNPANIYARLSIKANQVFKRKTGYVIDPALWSEKTNLPKQNDEGSKNIATDLQKLSYEIIKALNELTASGDEPTGDWLQQIIDKVQGKKQKTDNDRLINYIQAYIDNLPYKEWPNGKTGTSQATIGKYKTIKGKIANYENHTKKRYYLKDVSVTFRNEWLKYLKDVDKLSSNTAGRYIKFLKTVCLDAQANGYPVHPQLKQIKGFTQAVAKVFLTFDELQKIEDAKLNRPALINARDWLIIGCYIGQRVSDILNLTNDNLVVRAGIELIELKQKKTGKQVAIPLHPKVKEVLTRNGGKFPYKIAAANFNLYIKDVCRIAGIKQPVEGGKVNPKTKRKDYGTFPKYELITSHVCRRSFASNLYGEIPTALLISITAHATEQQFLQYIGKTTNDYAMQIAEYWRKQEQSARKETQLTVIKKAN